MHLWGVLNTPLHPRIRVHEVQMETILDSKLHSYGIWVEPKNRKILCTPSNSIISRVINLFTFSPLVASYTQFHRLDGYQHWNWIHSCAREIERVGAPERLISCSHHLHPSSCSFWSWTKWNHSLISEIFRLRHQCRELVQKNSISKLRSSRQSSTYFKETST